MPFGHPDLQFWRSRNPSGTHPDTPAVVMRHQVATSSGLFWQPCSITSREAGGTAPMARQLSCGPLHTTRPSWSSGEPARLNGAEQSLDGGSELREALFQRRGKRIEPVRRGDEIFERLARHGVLDPHRNDRQALGDRPLDFALDLRRSFACCEKISTSTLAPVIAVTINLPQSIPGTMSRGAIQQRIPACSSVARCTCRQRRGQEPPFTASAAGSISRNLPTRSFNEALQNRPASIAVCVFIILKASFLLAVACFNRWSLLSDGSRWR